MSHHDTYYSGLDVGSTTLKLVIVDPDTDDVVFSEYRRHNTDIVCGLRDSFNHAREAVCPQSRLALALAVTGSAGMGLAEVHGIP